MAPKYPSAEPYAGGAPSDQKFQAGKDPADTSRNADKRKDLAVPGSGRDSSAQGAPIAGTSNTQATYEADQHAG